jgi:hypothetical protein
VYANFNNYNKLFNHLTIKNNCYNKILLYYYIMKKQVLQNDKSLDLGVINIHLPWIGAGWELKGDCTFNSQNNNCTIENNNVSNAEQN